MMSNSIRIGVAAVALTCLAALVGYAFVPNEPIGKVVSYVLLAGAAIVVASMLLVAASSQLRQLVLRKGGTDPQWLWLASDRAGLVKLREEATAESSKGGVGPSRRPSGPRH